MIRFGVLGTKVTGWKSNLILDVDSKVGMRKEFGIESKFEEIFLGIGYSVELLVFFDGNGTI